MIPRIGEQGYWMFRYLERAERLARFLHTIHLRSLDNRTLSSTKGSILLFLSREADLYNQLHKNEETNYELIRDFFIWHETNPNSLFSCIKTARTNAQLIREIISNEIWQILNGIYSDMVQETSLSLFRKDPQKFILHTLNAITQLKGNFNNSLRRDEYFHFMKVGMLIERAAQVINMLYKIHLNFLFSISPEELEKQFILFNLLLEGFSSLENYLHCEQEFSLNSLTRFFLYDPTSPFSLTYCLENCLNDVPEISDYIKHLLQLIRTQNIKKPSLSSTEYNQLITALNAIHNSIQNHFLVCPSLIACENINEK